MKIDPLDTVVVCDWLFKNGFSLEECVYIVNVVEENNTSLIEALNDIINFRQLDTEDWGNPITP